VWVRKTQPRYEQRLRAGHEGNIIAALRVKLGTPRPAFAQA
jgi:hypothetical protein